MEKESFEMDSLLPKISSVLTILSVQNDNADCLITDFTLSQVPSISIKDYIARMHKFMGCSDICFMLGLIYIDKIIKSKNRNILNSLSVHRLYFTCVLLALKFWDDGFFADSYYAKIAGIDNGELKILQLRLLELLSCNLYLDTGLIETYFNAFKELKQEKLQ